MKIVGFSGLSSSGKTTVAKAISKLIPELFILHQDDFYYPPEKIPYHPILKEQNWDSPDAIDFVKFIETLHKIHTDPTFKYEIDSLELDETKPDFELSTADIEMLQNKIDANRNKLSGLCIVDGFMLYTRKEVMEELDLKLFYTAPFEDCKKRREARQGYNVIGGFWVDPPGYFEKMVWPEYYKYHKHLLNNGDNEQLIKETGGELNDYAKALGINSFNNPDGGTLFQLVNSTLDYIIQHI